MGRQWCCVWKFGLVLSLLAGMSAVPATLPAQEGGGDSASRDQLYKDLVEEAAGLERVSRVLKKAIKVARPTVVHIEARKPGDRKPIEEAGAGVIIRHRDKDYVLTNRHVIQGAGLRQITIRLSDNRTLYPTRVWSDQATDVAVMGITARNLIPARIGDSSKVEIGDFVLAVGSPFGLSQSVTFGIISAKQRRDLELGAGSVQVQNFLQTDAAINPGNSGGPLLNLRGEVIGINTAIASSSGGNDGIGFTIPANLAIYVARQLVDRGNVARAFLGVLLDSAFDAEEAARLGLPRPFGARIKGVTRNSAAETASLKAGDVILEFDGVRIDDDNHLINQVSITPVGKQVTLRVLRQGQSQEVKVTIGTRQGS